MALESDKKDIYELQRAFQSAGINDHLVVVRNRDEALCYLKGTGIYADRKTYPLPRLMLLDICAEMCGGLEVLTWVKSHPELSAALVVATGRDMAQRTAQEAYDLGASAVFKKPNDLEELADLVKSLEFLPNMPSITQL